jgi:hypothetical protein
VSPPVLFPHSLRDYEWRKTHQELRQELGKLLGKPVWVGKDIAFEYSAQSSPGYLEFLLVKMS